MWTLWFIPLIAAILLIVGASAIAALCFKRNRTPRRIIALLAAPFGCAALPVAVLAGMSVIATQSAQSDPEAWAELFGFPATQNESTYLFDAFGSNSDRALYMRIELTEQTWQRIQRIPKLAPSPTSQTAFVAQGVARGFTWWLESPDSPQAGFGETCETMRIWAADGYRGWGQFRIGECLGGHSQFAAPKKRRLFVIATRLPVAD
jgi:hypothetical protein